MLSIRLTALLGITLAIWLTSPAWGNNLSQEFENWATDLDIDRLPDKSVLNTYYAQTASLERVGAQLRLEFVPRFGCSPLLLLSLQTTPAGSRREPRTPESYASVEMNIDGNPLPFPVHVDDNESYLSVYHLGSLQSRVTARIKLDRGDILYVRSASGERLSFSLLGSMQSVRHAQEACRGYQPPESVTDIAAGNSNK